MTRRDYLEIVLWAVVVYTLVSLAGCETLQPRAPLVSQVRTIEIKVPVVQPCIDAASIEPLPLSAMPPAGSGVDQLASGAAVDLARLVELARKQQDMLRACAKVNQ